MYKIPKLLFRRFNWFQEETVIHSTSSSDARASLLFLSPPKYCALLPSIHSQRKIASHFQLASSQLVVVSGRLYGEWIKFKKSEIFFFCIFCSRFDCLLVCLSIGPMIRHLRFFLSSSHSSNVSSVDRSSIAAATPQASLLLVR